MSKTSKTSSPESSDNKDDVSINFRPSPNFKHMKKYRKSKFEEDINNLIENEKNLEAKNIVAGVVQPPLPPNSPPPDSPLSIVHKQEEEDNEYEQAAEEPAEEPPQIEPEHNEPIMCKDFVRKACTRGSACIYAHKIVFSQLDGVYKFCRDFANGCCKRPVCYFVHATNTEKEKFYRTAKLPSRALAHFKTPPTQPPTEVQIEVTKMPPVFTNPPPQPLPSVAVAPLLVGDAPPPAPAAPPAPLKREWRDMYDFQIEVTQMPPVFTNPPPQPLPSVAVAPLLVGDAPPPAPAAPPAPLKREWRDMYDFSSPPRDLDAKEPLARKCKRCELTELRLQHSKEQVAEAMRSSREMDEKLEHITKKNNRLHGVLRVLLKPRRVLEHVNNNFLAPSRLPAPPLLAQMKVLLTKILLGGEGSPERAAAGS